MISVLKSLVTKLSSTSVVKQVMSIL